MSSETIPAGKVVYNPDELRKRLAELGRGEGVTLREFLSNRYNFLEVLSDEEIDALRRPGRTA